MYQVIGPGCKRSLDKNLIEDQWDRNGTGICVSKRTSRLLATNECFLNKYMTLCHNSPWCKDKNPMGYVNMGTAENILCTEILVAKFNEPGFYKFDAPMLNYYTFHGTDSCRASLTKFITRYFKPSAQLHKDNLALISGTTSIFDMIAHIIADPGEYLMCPAPFYAGIKTDVWERSLVNVIGIDFPSEAIDGDEPFKIDVSIVIRTFEKARASGKIVKGIVLINPNNPLGVVYDKENLMPIFRFAAEQNLYVILDELYALSVYGGEFNSSFSYWDELPDRPKVIWIWGFSKDFGNAGLRCSVLYTENKLVLAAVQRLSVFQHVPVLIHAMVKKFVSDYDWLDNVYFPANLSALRKNCDMTKRWLNRLKIRYCEPKAGLFLFFDLSPYLKEKTKQAANELFQSIFRSGAYIVPGVTLMCSEIGWFRIIFSINQEALEEGLRRIEVVLGDLAVKCL